MNKLVESLRGVVEKFKALKLSFKIAIISSIVCIVLALVAFTFVSSSNKYGILFSNIDATDAQTVTAKLKEQKVDFKIEGNSILVPKESVDQLRLELAPDLSNGSKGFELMDQGSSFGMTDEEFKIKKLRMLQGEIEKTIKSFPQLKNARVHITEAQDSVFVKDATPGKAAVYIELKPGEKLEAEQVKSIVALVSGSVENLPKENVDVVDEKMNLLTKGLYDENGNELSTAGSSVEKRQALEKNYASQLEKNINALLEPVIGKGKVQSKVSVTLDLDAKQKTEVVIDPNKVIKSQEAIKESGNSTDSSTSSSPVDNNMSNTTASAGSGSSTSTKEQNKVEYAVGQTENKVITAPGEVKRVTASVIVDGKLDTATQDAIKNIVSSAIGFDQTRGDEINVLGMSFDQTEKLELQKQLDQIKAEEEKAQKLTMYKTIGIIAGSIIGAIIVLVIILKKFRKPKEEKEAHLLDVMVGEELEPKEIEKFEPIDFEVNNQKTHIENEIKRYATEKPEQVAEVVKSWLADNERG